MDDQIDEKEVLECGGWGQEYDIADDEEERLLIEEDEIIEPSNQQDREFEDHIYEGDESVDPEEDILVLDATEAFVEFDDPLGNGSEDVPKESTSASTGESPSTSTESPAKVPQQSNAAQERKVAAQKRAIPYSRNPHMRRNNMHNRQSNHAIPVQMAYSSGRPRPGGFINQMRPLDSLMPSPIGRRPLMGDPRFPPPPIAAPRHPMLNRMEPHMPNFHPRMLHNTLRLPFKDQNPFSFNHVMQNEVNHGANRFFVNHPYPPRNSRDIRNLSAGSGPPFTEIRPPFSSSDMLPKLFHGPPPPRPHEIVGANSLLTHQRFSTNLPPPPLPAHAAALAQGPHLRMKFQSPQSLMDIVLAPPFGDAPLQQPMFPDRQPRFRFNSPEHRNHRPDFAQPPPTSGPPPGGNKRPPAKESTVPVIPLKQFRNEPRVSLPIQRTFTNNLTEASPIMNRIVDSSARNLVRSYQQSSPGSQKKSLLGTPPKPTAALLPTPTSTAGVPASVASSSVSLDASNVSPTSWKIDTQGDGASQEMDEYLKKMEEQRKKREEVLRIKEERRRLKLAGKSEDGISDVTITQNTSSTLPGMRASDQGELPRYVPQVPTTVNNATHAFSIPVKRADGNLVPGNSAVASPRTNGEPAVLPNESKRSIKVVTQSAQKVPQQTLAHSPRYKVIIVKNKLGQILEKRRVPLGEGVNTDTLVNKEISQVTSAWSNSRMSETVEIENLNSNATEDDVRKLCQMFGPVQEVYPKLQEGKAIVRFTSVKGANNFLCNHNTPGILVRYL